MHTRTAVAPLSLVRLLTSAFFVGLLAGAFARADTLLSKTVYSSAGSYSYSVPSGTSYLIVKCWGAGGGNYGLGGFSYGGRGGYVSAKLLITSGTYLVRVGAGGASNGSSGGSGGGGSDFGSSAYGLGAGGGGGGSGGGGGGWWSGGDGGAYGGLSIQTYSYNASAGGYDFAGNGGVDGQGAATAYDLTEYESSPHDSDWASPAGIGAGNIDFVGHDGRVVIIAYNAAPGITSALSQRNLNQRQSENYTITASNSPTSFGASNLPPGLSVNTSTGVISGTAVTPATYNATITATNAMGSDSKTLVWEVTAASITPAASVTPSVQRNGQVVSLYRDGTANFGVAWTENLIWQPDGQAINLGNASLGGPLSYTPVGGAGTYLYQFRLVDNYSNFVDQFISFEVGAVQSLQHATGFESADGFTAGSLHQQQGWVVALGSASVSTEQAQAGSNGIKLTPAAQTADVRKYFSQGQNWAFIDVYVRPVAAAAVADSSILDYGSSRIGFVTASGQGAIYLFDGYGNGTGAWVDTQLRFPVNGSGQSTEWLRITVRHDYSAHKWDLYVNGVPVEYDCGMVSNAASSFTDLNWWGHASAATYLDGFTASTTNPLFTDAGHDGMADSWETAGGLNVATDDRNGDRDGDGRSNVREYFEGTDPNNADVTLPIAPASLAILATQPGSVSLSWSAGTDAGSGVGGYNVYRNGTKLNASLLTSRNYTDTTVSAGTSYSYTVRTVDAAGNVSDVSVSLTIVTPASSTSGAFEIFSPLP